MTICLTFLQSIDFEKFKPVMLAALRSLLPKQWSTKHETAWEWLWLTVARNLKDSQPKKYSWMKLRWCVFHKSDSSFGTEESTMKVRAFKPYNAKLFSSLSEEQLDRFRHSTHLILTAPSMRGNNSTAPVSQYIPRPTKHKHWWKLCESFKTS